MNAYLRQRLGFNNTARLKDGILGYERWVEGEIESTVQEKSLFVGKNFVFDRRRLAENE